MQPNENDTKAIDEKAKEIMEGSSDAWLILDGLNQSTAGLVMSTKPVMIAAYKYWDGLLAFIDSESRAGFESTFKSLETKLAEIAQKIPEIAKLHKEGKGHPQEGDNLMAVADQYTKVMEDFNKLERNELHIVTTAIHEYVATQAEAESK